MIVGHIGGGTSAPDTGDIGHSLRFRSGASAYLSRTMAAGTSAKKWTVSLWVKRGALGTNSQIFSAGTSGTNLTLATFDAGDTLQFYDYNGAYQFRLITTQLFRDPTSWIHLLFVVDTDNATANDRQQIWVNGTRITAFGTNTTAGSGNTTRWNTNVSHVIGEAVTGAPFFDGYLSRICVVDGQALTPSSFGYQNTEINEWVSKSQSAVKAVVDAGGTNSFMLDFDDATSLTTLGYDKSSKGNNWTLNNFSLTAGTTYDHMLDVPGNSFATLNPLIAASTGVGALTNGNLQCITPTAGASNNYGTIGVSVGKWYWEITATARATDSHMMIGINDNTQSATEFYSQTRGYAYRGNGEKWNNGSGVSYGSPAATGDIIGVAFDADSGSIEFFRNGSSMGVAYTSIPTATYFPAICDTGTTVSWTATANFGQRPFAYTPPTGYKALCQRNLPDPVILNPKNGFVSVIATEDNIYSTLAAARSGWTDYVDILKNRAASESWAWQFSHDSSNEYAVAASSLVRQTKRTQSGSNNWVGYSIRIGATYGTAAGSVSHTNGAATTITHNVGVSARQLILLFNRAGGSAVPVYHPDLTSGELLDLCTTAADAASTAITSVGTNSFQIGSAAATGTYDYLVCSEISQFFDLGTWTGNAAADGVYYDAGHKPAALLAKQKITTGDHRVYDDLRPGYNVIGGVVLANTNGAETTAAEIDTLAFGIKGRTTTTPNAAEAMVTASWASVAGKFSLGR